VGRPDLPVPVHSRDVSQRLPARHDTRPADRVRELVERLCADGARRLSCDEYSLFVWQDNQAALRLYRGLGFVEARYPKPSPALNGMLYMVRRA
jgi:hypothetical protein